MNLRKKMKSAGKWPAGLLAILLLVAGAIQPLQAFATSGAQDTKGVRVVVIDPGHGGENNGDESTELFEKYRTLITAQAMYEELSKYEDVIVYMTRTDDVDMSLKERAEFAGSVNADLVCSIHYNASIDHEIFGAEIWIPSQAPLNGIMYQLGRVWMDQMKAMGLHLRGIKSRLGQNGDYYGIIRESAALGIPAVILEHCHLDVAQDLAFADTEEKMRAFGRADATAVAQFYGLKSTALGVDYSDTQVVQVPTYEVAQFPLNVSTVPERCDLSIVSQNEETGEVTFRIDAQDSEEALQYYDYSTDGGMSFGNITVWPGYELYKADNTPSVTFTVTLPRDVDTEFIARVYNGYDQKTESEKLTIHFAYQDEMRAAALAWEREHEAAEAATNPAPAVGGGPDDIILQTSEGVMLEAVNSAENVPLSGMGTIQPFDGTEEGKIAREYPGTVQKPGQQPASLQTALLFVSAGLLLTLLVVGTFIFRKKKNDE